MAFSFFGKKDKNPTEGAAPVAKTPPTPPKIQTPPVGTTIPAVKPPQPSGLIPTSGMPAGAATTQPMVMPRAGSGLKPTRPGVVQSTRSTQRIVLPGGVAGVGGKSSGTKSLPNPAAAPAGRINLPIGMILRCLPSEVLAADMAQFEAAGTAATEIGLPMNMILSQLPSGKVEMTLADLVPHFPPGYLQPTASITNYLPTVVNLPLMDVVMRIPPDLLALRPDQKGVDASVINMADPFTEEILREQAEAARRQQSQTNIIEESQAPTEEFVPAAPVPKTIAPPVRSPGASGVLPPPPVPAGRLPGSAAPTAPAVPKSASTSSRLAIPNSSARTISPSGSLSVPTRATTPIPARPQAAVTSQLQPPPPLAPQPTTPIPAAPVAHRIPAAMPAAPTPPVPRNTTALPMPPAPTMPAIPRQVPPTAFVPPTPVAPQPPIAAPLPVVEFEPEPESEPIPETAAIEMPAPGEPDAGADDLARLAALAMAQMGEGEEPDSTPTDLPVTQEISEPISGQAPPLAAPTMPLPMPTASPMAFTPPPALIPTPAPIAFTPPAPAEVKPPVPAPTPAPFVFNPPAPAPVPVAATPQAPVPMPPAQTSTAPLPPTPVATAPAQPEVKPEENSDQSGAFNLNTCTVEDLLQIPGCFRELAEAIIRHRGIIGTFQKIEDLLDVPGITKEAYTNLTGEQPPANRIPLTLNELLGFPVELKASLKDVTDRICCWPDITGCVLSQGSGLSLVGHTPPTVDKAALVAFVPKMFDALNKSFSEVSGKETNDLIIPTAGTSYHIFRDNDLYLIILCRLPQMPERHLKVARFVLAALSARTT